MKKHQSKFYLAIIILSIAIFMLPSCKKKDNSPEAVEKVYTIGDTLVSQFVDETTGEVLQRVVVEMINIGTKQDTIGYWAVKYHSNLEETQLYEDAYYDVVTIDELQEFMEDVEAIYGSEAGSKLASLGEKYSTPLQFIVGGCIESEIDINDYFDVLQTIDTYYMDENLPVDDEKNRQVEYFLDFLFYNGIDVDDLLKLLTDRGLTLTDLLEKMGTSDFYTIGAEYNDYTDTSGIEGFNEFLNGLFGLTKSSSDGKGGGDVLKIVGGLVQDVMKEADATFSGPTFSTPVSLLYGNNLNPLNYIGQKEGTDLVTWSSGSNWDHIVIEATCDYKLTTDLHDGLFVANAQIAFKNKSIGAWHHVSSDISSTGVNVGTLSDPIAEIRTKVSVTLRVKCLFLGQTWSDGYYVTFNGQDGVEIFRDFK